MTKLILGLSTFLLFQSNTISGYPFLKEYYSNENGYVLNYKNKKELSELEIAIEGSKTGNAINFVTNWLNDDDYQNKFPFKTDEELIGDTDKEKVINNFYLGYFLFKKGFDYPFAKFSIETEYDVVRIREFLDFFNSQKDSVLGMFDLIRDEEYSSCIDTINDFENAFNSTIKEIWFDDDDYSDYYEDLRSTLKFQSDDVRNGNDNSFDVYQNVHKAISTIPDFFNVNINQDENFASFIDDLSLNNDIRNFESDYLLNYVPKLSQVDFGEALDEIRSNQFSGEIDDGTWNSFSNEEKLNFSKTFYSTLDRNSRIEFYFPIFEKLDDESKKEASFKIATYTFGIFNLSLSSFINERNSSKENFKTLFNNFGPIMSKFLDLCEAVKDCDYTNINILVFQSLCDLKILADQYEDNIFDLEYLKTYESLRLSAALNNFKTDSGYNENKLEVYQNYLDRIENATSKSDVINLGEDGVYKLNGTLVNSNENISLLSYEIKNFTNSNNFKETYNVECLNISDNDVANKLNESNKNSKKNISKNFNIKICDKKDQNFYDLGENNLGTFTFEFNKTDFCDFGLIRFRNGNVETILNGVENKNEFGEYFEVEDDKIILHVRHLGFFSFAYNEVYRGLPAGAIVGIVLGSVFLFFFLFILIGYIVWKKKGKAIKFMIPMYRKINKLFFKTEYNDVELKEQESQNKE